MVTKIIVGAFALVVVIVVAAVVLRGRGTSARSLTDDEEIIRRLVREVYGDTIKAETVSFTGDDAIMTISLRDEKLGSLEVNLSSLARKHREQGLSLAVIKKGLQF